MTDSAINELVDRGLEAHRSGRMSEAIAAYRSALAIKPDDAEVLSLMGLALSQGGRPDEALLLLGRAVDIEPKAVGFRLNLAEGFATAGQLRRALQEFQAVASLQPTNVRAWDRAGDMALALSDAAAAIDGWGRSYLVDYQNIDAALKIARFEIGRDRVDVAMNLLDSVLSRTPMEPRTLALKCNVLEQRRDWLSLMRVSSEWCRARPGDVDAWRIVARAAFEQGRHVDAIDAFRRVLQLTTPTAEDWSSYAGLCLHALDFGTAADALNKSEQLDPNAVQMLANRALLLMYQGQFAKAEEYCRRCLAVDPTHVPTYTTLSRLRSGRLTDPELQAVTALSRREDLGPDRRIPSAFAVAHALDARKEVDAAFREYEYAHGLARERDRSEGQAYDRAQREQQTQRLIELSRVEFPVPAPSTGAMRPIFIVGMPRSGTTLVESVLSAHSRVLAMGERPAMQQILRAFLEGDKQGLQPDAATMTSWSRACLAGCVVADGKDHLTDKHPLNFDAVGLIARLFPYAAIIHVRRDPIETGLSIFRQEFNKHWRFAHRLEDIGHFYGTYARLAHHWQELLPERFVTIQYEEFVTDFEVQAESLVRSCGLDWEPECLDFQDTVSRAIATFSTVQAREPVRSNNGRAARYAAHLQPLVTELERAGVDLRTGALQA
ncbi:sulfotransferase [Povalibacter sp.]|uniref:sulfotransferase n=1 Tax=Povalibacter sp. TaxID=1962978 RepID=UPI002F41CB46